MLEYLAFPVAIVFGFLAGLGVGGGSLLMLWLTSVMNMDYCVAKTVNLLFFLPTALIATVFHKKQGSIKIRKILPGIICACFADKPTKITFVGLSKDILTTVECVKMLGARVEFFDGSITVIPCRREMIMQGLTLDCNESGSTARFLLPIAAAICKNVTITGSGRLPERIGKCILYDVNVDELETIFSNALNLKD
jgi:hypothetical protein